jgi:ABC-type Fe3+/spermidine/putrescine transport system ATPase subunit
MISMQGLRFEIGSFSLDVSLDIPRGEYFVLMGPPGSGKSMLVEFLAGLRTPTAGSIRIAGRDVTTTEPRRRGVGYVPQDYALFSTRSVYGNIAFGPQVHGLSRKEVDLRVREAVRLLDIERLLDRRRVQGLSGGERQRVALARALAVRPDVLILDEPVSALDEATRESICGELRRLQRRLGLTTIHISHNLEEAFSVADRGAVMQGGRIRQVGRLEDLLRRPASEFVARFMRCENILNVQGGPGPSPGLSQLDLPWGKVTVPGDHRGELKAAVRPENLLLARPDDTAANPPAGLSLRAGLLRSVDRGAYVRLSLKSNPSLVAHLPHRTFAELDAAEGAELVVTIPPEALHLLPADPDSSGKPS